MEFAIKYGIEFKDDSVQNSTNSSKFDIAFKALSVKKTATDQDVEYYFDKFEKVVFQLDKDIGAAFDKDILTEILSGIDMAKVKGLYIHCYNTTPEDSDLSPVRFELWNGGQNGALAFKTSDFCIGGLKDFAIPDFRIKNIVMETGKTANLQIIALIEQ